MEANQTDEKGLISWLARTIEAVPEKIDEAVQKIDNFLGRKRSLFHGRSLQAFLLPVPVYLFIIIGPSIGSSSSLWRGGFLAFVLIAATLLIQLGYFLQDKYHGMAWVQLGLTMGLAILTSIIADTKAVQASTELYHHYYSYLAAIAMLVAVLVAALMKECDLFKPLDSDITLFKRTFDRDQVIAQGAPRKLNKWDVIGAYVTAMLAKPLHVIAIAAVVVLALPPQGLKLWSLIAFIISWMIIATSIYDTKRDAFARMFQRIFLSGGALIVTLTIIVLAALRLAGYDYVTTPIDAGSKWTLFSYIISTYALFWFYDFWVNQAIIDLVIKNDDFFETSKIIRRHGGGRLAIGDPEGKARMFEPAAFLMRIAEIAPAGDRQHLKKAARRAEQQFRTFATVCLVVFALALGGIGYHFHGLEQVPVLSSEDNDTGNYHLLDHLVSSAGKPVVMLAASGGGTRAALYTASVLHGLSEQGQLDQMVLASGVSGGSAALAYYAIHRPDDSDPSAWTKMMDTLSYPFIDDVLAGAAEHRIVSNSRLGHLLCESFERCFLGTDPSAAAKQRVTFDGNKDLGLIFNTTLCSAPGKGAHSAAAASKLSAGGRLVVTNLTSNFDKKASSDHDQWRNELAFEIIRPLNKKLFAAASLSANFPPVFSNAPVKVSKERSYWVTDGGAVENRGLISILLALADTFDAIIKSKQTVALPDIRIVVADASALNPEYKSDRGMGAKLGASKQLANRLINELFNRISQQHETITKRAGGIKRLDLPMPDAMRAKGTFGTHWMMPDHITIKNPYHGDKGIEIDKSDLKEIMIAMFSEAYSEAYLQSKWPRKEALANVVWNETKGLKEKLRAFFN